MKLTIKKCFLYISILCVCLCLATFPTFYAEEIGQIQTKAGVGFYESSTSSSTISSTKTSGSTIVTKPNGRLPSAGELAKTSLSISGLILLILVLVIFLRKKKKKRASREGR
ncbi:hypothetical protein A5881_003863 [Enterococcus termitis]|nr:hypothetical protein A5881_003751 [Enterococcus termitis]